MSPNPRLRRYSQRVPASGRLAVVADREQPVLDGEPDAFLDQGSRDAGNAGAVGTLPHQFFEVGDGGERQGDRNTVGFGFFCGHAKKLAVKRCTEKYLFRVYSGRWAGSRLAGMLDFAEKMPREAPQLVRVELGEATFGRAICGCAFARLIELQNASRCLDVEIRKFGLQASEVLRGDPMVRRTKKQQRHG